MKVFRCHMDDFMKLWSLFKSTFNTLNEHLLSAGKTPFYSRQVERFNEKIVRPMDEAWSKLTQDEKDSFVERLSDDKGLTQ